MTINPTDTIIISDWHLGFPASQVDKIHQFLDSLIANKPIQKLILNGDIFDLNWKKLDKIIDEYYDVLKKLVKINQRGTKVIYTLGNHDPLTNKQKNKIFDVLNNIGLNDIRILPAYQLQRNGYSYLVNHGHMFDTFISEHKLLSNLSDIGYRLLIGFDNIFKIGLSQLVIYFVRKFFNYSKQVEKRCRWFLAKKNYHAILLGHTHVPKILDWQINNKLKLKPSVKLKYLVKKQRLPKRVEIKQYCNSGDWVESGHCSYLTVSKKGEVKLKYFN